jgi:hypothetical protein
MRAPLNLVFRWLDCRSKPAAQVRTQRVSRRCIRILAGVKPNISVCLGPYVVDTLGVGELAGNAPRFIDSLNFFNHRLTPIFCGQSPQAVA